MSRRKFVLFAAIAAAGSMAVLLVSLVGADLYLHQRAERSAGLNRWGYRGPVVGRKQPHEIRVAAFGGSTVFGYGVRWDEALPALLEQELNRSPRGVSWRVVNLGYNNEGAFAARINLDDFAFVDFDLVVLYEGYNDLMGDGAPNRAAPRHESPVFRLTGYMPILPLVFQEKAMALRAGSVAAAYPSPNGAPKAVFKPTLTNRTAAAALEAAAGVATTLERQVARLSDPATPAAAGGAAGCPEPWRFYCDAQYRAIEYATSGRKRVLVVSQPLAVDERVRATHESQKDALAAMLARHFGQRPDVAYVDLRDAVNLGDPELSFDGMHLTAAGNRAVAGALAAPIQQLQSR